MRKQQHVEGVHPILNTKVMHLKYRGSRFEFNIKFFTQYSALFYLVYIWQQPGQPNPLHL